MTKPTFFQTGPEKVVPVKDIYHGAKPKYPEKDEGFKSSAKPVRSDKDVSKLVKTIKTDQAGILRIDKDAAIKALRSSTKRSGNPIGDLTNKQQDDVLYDMGVGHDIPGSGISNSFTSLSNRANKIKNSITGTIDLGNTKRLIRNGDVNSVNGVVGIINTLTNGSVLKVEDFNSKLAIINSVMGDLQRYGIIESIDYILKTMADSRSKKRMLSRLVPMFFMNGDINNLNLAIKSLGAGRVMALYPEGISAFCSGFRYHRITKPEQYKDYRNRIIALFNKLDPKWNVSVRDGVEINNLESLTYMSTSFYNLFKNFSHSDLNFDIFPDSGETREVQTRRFITMIMIAKNFPSSHVERFMTRAYPKALFTFKRSR